MRDSELNRYLLLSGSVFFGGIISVKREPSEKSLSAILESEVPQRFFLSPRAAAGILRRAAKHGRTLPSHLQAALEALAMHQAGASKTTSTSSSKLCPQSGPKEAADQRETNTTISSHPPSEVSTEKKPIEETAQTTLFASTPRNSPIPPTEAIPGPETPAIHFHPQPTLPQSSDLTEKTSPGHSVESAAETISEPTKEHSLVRRLTPVECEKLQGFPVGWTLPDTGH